MSQCHGLGFEAPYRYGSETRTYLPDFKKVEVEFARMIDGVVGK